MTHLSNINHKGTQTGRIPMRKSNIEELPKGANYMVTTNRAQMVAAIKAVPHEGTTIIDAINAQGKRLVRYTFKGIEGIRRLSNQNADYYEKHLRKTAREVQKTPAENTCRSLEITMFGQNPVRKQELDEEGRLWIQEIFSTLQGEGEHAGTPSIFIRLAGCNLTCEFCDTDFESAFDSPVNLMGVTHISTIVNRMAVQDPGCTNIVITGGEPFRQNFVPLASHLLSLGFTIEIETAGTLWLEDFDKIAKNCHVTVSPKTRKINKRIEEVAAVYKYVVSCGSVITLGDKMIPGTAKKDPLPLPKYNQPIFIQPMDDPDKHEAARNIKVAVNLVKQTGWRLSVQTHKYIGVE